MNKLQFLIPQLLNKQKSLQAQKINQGANQKQSHKEKEPKRKVIRSQSISTHQNQKIL